MGRTIKTKIVKNILREIKIEKWKSERDKNYIKKGSRLVTKLQKNHLSQIRRENEQFVSAIASSDFKPREIETNADSSARAAFDEWKKKHEIRQSSCDEVHVENLLLLMHRLKTKSYESYKESKMYLCWRRQNSSFETFWDSSSRILQALRHCVFTKDWNTMTCFLIMLLNYGSRYLPVVQNMCSVMYKLNSLIQDCGLEDEFKMIADATALQTTVI